MQCVLKSLSALVETAASTDFAAQLIYHSFLSCVYEAVLGWVFFSLTASFFFPVIEFINISASRCVATGCV